MASLLCAWLKFSALVHRVKFLALVHRVKFLALVHRVIQSGGASLVFCCQEKCTVFVTNLEYLLS